MLLISGHKTPTNNTYFNPYPSRNEYKDGFSGTSFQSSPAEYNNNFKLNVEEYDYACQHEVKTADPSSFDFVLQRLEATMGRNYNECLLRKPEIKSATPSELDLEADLSSMVPESPDIEIEPNPFINDESPEMELKLALLKATENLPRRVLGRGRARRKSGPAPLRL
jgi:hypothetical protein